MDTSKKYKLLRNLIIISFCVEPILIYLDLLGFLFLMDKSDFFLMNYALIPTPSLLLAVFAAVCMGYFYNVKKSMTENKKTTLLFAFSLFMVLYHVAGHAVTVFLAMVGYFSRF